MHATPLQNGQTPPQQPETTLLSPWNHIVHERHPKAKIKLTGMVAVSDGRIQVEQHPAVGSHDQSLPRHPHSQYIPPRFGTSLASCEFAASFFPRLFHFVGDPSWALAHSSPSKVPAPSSDSKLCASNNHLIPYSLLALVGIRPTEIPNLPPPQSSEQLILPSPTFEATFYPLQESLLSAFPGSFVTVVPPRLRASA